MYEAGVDFDILIVCDDLKVIASIKKDLKIAFHNIPLHAVFLDPSEEIETNFVKANDCLIFELIL